EIFGHRETEVAITAGGDPALRGCSIRDGVVGVLVSEGGRGAFESCDVTGHRAAGVAIRAGAAPTLDACRVRANGDVAVRAEADSGGSVVDCDLTGNARGAWAVDPGSALRGSGNLE